MQQHDKDCNTCSRHKQAQPTPKTCRVCLPTAESTDVKSVKFLPHWDPIEPLQIDPDKASDT